MQQEVVRIGVAHLSNVSGFRLQLYLSDLAVFEQYY